MKIALLISSLRCGGAERVLTNLADAFAKLGHDVVVYTWNTAKDDFYHFKQPNVKRITPSPSATAGFGKSISNNLKRVAWLRSSLKREQREVLISFIDTTNVMAILASGFLGVRVIVCERCNPLLARIPWQWDILRRATYPFAEALVVQTSAAEKWAKSLFPKLPSLVIPNPLSDACGRLLPGGIQFSQAKAPSSFKQILLVGRLVPQKQTELFIRHIAAMLQRRGDCRVTICGDGPGRTEIESACTELGVNAYVDLVGTVNDLPIRYSAADIFVLCSAFEGFPNALLEAMSHSVACVSFSCDHGPTDLISDGRTGIIVPVNDWPTLVTRIEELIDSPQRRHLLGTLAATAVQQNFNLDKIVHLWTKLIHREM
jgi:glycosyltransferase involved in cell wall biosynthesis